MKKNTTNKIGASLLNKLISSSIREGVYIIDGNYLCTFINDAALQMLGYSREQCIGKKMHHFIHNKYPNGEFYSETECPICETFLSKESTAVENDFFCKSDGGLLEVRYTSTPVIDDGNLIGMLVVFSDISNLKKKETELIELQNRKEILINSTDDLMWSIDLDCRLTAFNKAYEQKILMVTGKPITIGSPVIEKEFGAELVAKWEGYYNKALKGEIFKVKEELYNPKRNEKEYSLIKFTPIYNTKNEVAGAACYSRDITEDILANILIAENNYELEKVLEQSIDMICTIDEEGRFIKMGASCTKILGFVPDELIGKKYIDLVHPEDIPKTIEVSIDIMNGKETPHFENRYITKSGKTVPILWSAKWDNRGKVMYCIARDNTYQKIAEKKLADSETFLNEAQHLAKMGNWNFDFRTDKLTWSDELYNVFDTDNKTFLETHGSFIHLIDENDRPLVVSTSKHSQETGESFNIQYRITTAKGEKRIIEEFGYGEKDKDGNVVRLFGTAQDITERRKSEIALQQSEARLKGIIASQTNYILRTDLQGNYTYCNQKFKDDFGWLHDADNVELIGVNCMVSIMPYHHQAVQDVVKKCFANPNQVFQIEIDKPAKNNGVKTTLWDFILLTDPYGRPDEMQCAGIDIADRKKAELELKQLNEQLQKQTNDLEISNADLEQFAYVASHDLQEPLRMVTSFLSQLEKKYGDVIDDKGKQYINFAVDGAKRMRQIILDLLEFSRVGKTEDQLEYLNLNDLLNEVILLLRKNIEEKSATISIDQLPEIRSHRSPLRQVFQNLISNALKYSNKKIPVQINITVKEFNDHWLFAVIDNGIGIENEYFEKIFILFQRLHNKDEYSGTGMGLAITKKIIGTLGGKIWVESELGKGSSFYFTIKK